MGPDGFPGWNRDRLWYLRAVRTRFQSRTLIAAVCLAVLLLAVLAAGAHGPVYAILAPFWLFLETLVLVSILPRAADSGPDPFPFAAAFASRPPPIQ